MPVLTHDLHSHLGDGLDYSKANQTWAIADGVNVSSDKSDGVYSNSFGSILQNDGHITGFSAVGAYFARTGDGPGATVINGPNGSIAGAYGVAFEGAQSSLVNQGSITGVTYNGVWLLGAVNKIDNTGLIWGAQQGVKMTGFLDKIINDGRIMSGVDGVLAAGTYQWIVNHGLISGAINGVELNHAAGAIIDNYGTIDGGVRANDSDLLLTNRGLITQGVILGDGADTVINPGQIQGGILFGKGDDHYDGQGGSTNGYFVFGQDGRDTLAGGDGADHFFGGANGDFLNGRGGDDVLVGGYGPDKLTGGAGVDSFVFQYYFDSYPGAGRDVITDFSHAEHDRIDLSAIDAVQLIPGPDDAFHFIGTAAFSHTAGELRYEVFNGNAAVAADINGDGAADFGLLLLHVTSLTADDFVL